MKTAIATVSISGDFTEKLAAIAAAGFDGIEIFENDFLAFDGGPREVGQMVRDHGLEISLFQPFRDFEGMPEPQRARVFDRAERKFELMGELGADLVLVCSNVSPLALGGIDRAAADFHELGERAARHGIRVGYEALAWGRHVSDHRDAWEIVRRADHPNVGLILDSFHTLARKIDPETIRSIPGDRIFFVQLADAPKIEMDLLYWSRHFRNMPGEGDLDVLGFVRAIAATGYDDVLSLEVFNDQFRGGSPKSISIDGHRSLIYLMDQVNRSEPDVRMSVPQMPDRIKVDGVEFVEFAADEEEAAELGAILHTLGFKRSGKHVSKDVDLWSQGGVKILINTEREGFAHSSYVVHGANVCDIGLRVNDAAATVQRARVLGADPFEQPIGPGQLKIPAIRGVGGGLIHFIDGESDLARVWDIEFEQVSDAKIPVDAGLTRIDHIAQTMNYEEMLTWLLFYTSIFETEKTPMVDVVDPAGLVRSQVIENASGSLRITLNGAENRRTLAGHFLAESFGSSVQHLAFATDDIFAAADALEANGFVSLVISPNYYDDLDARFGLDSDFLDRLRERNILYDRDDHGEYFQLYSPSYGEGFFFELVERRGGYRGYGAANAQFRIAAQKRHMRPAGMPRH
ncbi:MAG: sugar phosphate isomerase/epimerase and 4-hydroxyphenylpyruvate domain-containing protein [Hoeflea sp.]|uniref:bifunctional sugar phosphate isomerase/epimerase/4-hydroxyphenylpyruvate dioxygenase family protein n=1 Tax=Hoeflea sp. TaxID=1940281 RepID=UPI001D7E2A4A|nr:sugar phosphate isomerase/epimerase and 4-hydroxyphenylpyruvate domain-containing protein [Hoeflea sp.]MBU4527780.1 sugar phosphate isomerase/epimerase and 4-hydroxyphenylpyruvate domain-containing protein [Alphaproteobacteria bacterium]MBU4546185.1 sugar phosphate isomerase/epimerase and 4-hydroxyphenylpyruvate domain-containing protein [Alphaproteobacteria bacterium]MBU4553130.1 sugar phosphate isomerase/epimerase and 4-hydroxyphenylpyruvate domain-containing protein [Alphaproteobacteria ba